MPTTLRAAVLCCGVAFTLATAAGPDEHAPAAIECDRRVIHGWTIFLNRDLLADGSAATTEEALVLLAAQLEEIEQVVPAQAVTKLREVPLYFSTEYEGTPPRAEYHPHPAWLREHGRDPAMARAVEFTNVRIFAEETVRMPNFVLHELAHAYHDRFLPDGFANAAIKKAYDAAVASGRYDKVERRNGTGRPPSFERAYALSTPQEYFAEATEAFFSRNDFFPFTKDDLRRHDPEMATALEDLWSLGDAAKDSATRPGTGE